MELLKLILRSVVTIQDDIRSAKRMLGSTIAANESNQCDSCEPVVTSLEKSLDDLTELENRLMLLSKLQTRG